LCKVQNDTPLVPGAVGKGDYEYSRNTDSQVGRVLRLRTLLETEIELKSFIAGINFEIRA